MFRHYLLLIPVSLILLLSSCQFKETFSEFRDFPEKGWNRYDTLFFHPKLDENTPYNLYIDTRNSNLYPYQNLWVFISCKMDSVVLFSDTVNIALADKTGKWYGSGWGSLYEYSVPVKQNMRFPKGKNCIIKVVQGMREYDLKGIESAGLHIERAK